MFYQAQIKKIELYSLITRYVSRLHLFSLFTSQFRSTFGGVVMERYYKKLRLFLYGKLMFSACYASNSTVKFNHKGFVICSNNLATYVLSGTDKKKRTLFTYYKVCITVTPFSLFSLQFWSTFGCLLYTSPSPRDRG